MPPIPLGSPFAGEILRKTQETINQLHTSTRTVDSCVSASRELLASTRVVLLRVGRRQFFAPTPAESEDHE